MSENPKVIERAELYDFERDAHLSLRILSVHEKPDHGWGSELTRWKDFAHLHWREAGSPNNFEIGYGGGLIKVSRVNPRNG